MTILLRIAPYLAAIIAVAVVLFGAYSHGVKVEGARRQAEVAGIRQQHAVELQRLDATHRDALQAELQRARQAEAAHAQAMAEIDHQHSEELRNAQVKADADIAALRAGTIRVRERLTCAAPAANDSPGSTGGQTSASARLGDAAQARGLSSADIELVLRIGAEADAVARQLSACQAIVSGDRR